MSRLYPLQAGSRRAVVVDPACPPTCRWQRPGVPPHASCGRQKEAAIWGAPVEREPREKVERKKEQRGGPQSRACPSAVPPAPSRPTEPGLSLRGAPRGPVRLGAAILTPPAAAEALSGTGNHIGLAPPPPSGPLPPARPPEQGAVRPVLASAPSTTAPRPQARSPPAEVPGRENQDFQGLPREKKHCYEVLHVPPSRKPCPPANADRSPFHGRELRRGIPQPQDPAAPVVALGIDLDTL
ncbi:basic proline-rich protein-like [Dryobates pubescens]|uniref:basic proline-rich protein-like n=1 Tax=Dryobates pubescens TaxID=118200 RepID=UPI0023BA243B|nr:basic proline-rich protein-like [Dryobates pubescens]